MGYIMDDMQNQKVLKENYTDAIKRRVYPQDAVPAKGKVKPDDPLKAAIQKRKKTQYGTGV